MDIYIVGGAVRDELLGRPVVDRDYVVVGASPQAMLDQGYRPVGKDFPVFLHPETHAEYALARTERKTGHGYHGFAFHAAPDVTLEQDLARRDLTINAMARAADGTLIDPFCGRRDLEGKILRHVGPNYRVPRRMGGFLGYFWCSVGKRDCWLPPGSQGRESHRGVDQNGFDGSDRSPRRQEGAHTFG